LNKDVNFNKHANLNKDFNKDDNLDKDFNKDLNLNKDDIPQKNYQVNPNTLIPHNIDYQKYGDAGTIPKNKDLETHGANWGDINRDIGIDKSGAEIYQDKDFRAYGGEKDTKETENIASHEIDQSLLGKPFEMKTKPINTEDLGENRVMDQSNVQGNLNQGSNVENQSLDREQLKQELGFYPDPNCEKCLGRGKKHGTDDICTLCQNKNVEKENKVSQDKILDFVPSPECTTCKGSGYKAGGNDICKDCPKAGFQGQNVDVNNLKKNDLEVKGEGDLANKNISGQILGVKDEQDQTSDIKYNSEYHQNKAKENMYANKDKDQYTDQTL